MLTWNSESIPVTLRLVLGAPEDPVSRARVEAARSLEPPPLPGLVIDTILLFLVFFTCREAARSSRTAVGQKKKKKKGLMDFETLN